MQAILQQTSDIPDGYSDQDIEDHMNAERVVQGFLFNVRCGQEIISYFQCIHPEHAEPAHGQKQVYVTSETVRAIDDAKHDHYGSTDTFTDHMRGLYKVIKNPAPDGVMYRQFNKLMANRTPVFIDNCKYIIKAIQYPIGTEPDKCVSYALNIQPIRS